MDKQLHLPGMPQQQANQPQSLVSHHPETTTEASATAVKAQVGQQTLEAYECPGCGQQNQLEFDICHGERNAQLCAACIRKRHETHGLAGNGFEIAGEWVTFYSQTTGIERFKTQDIYRVFRSLAIIGANAVFPYSIGVMGPIGYPNGRTEWGRHCFGVTTEFGDWLKSNFAWKKVNLFGSESDEAWERQPAADSGPASLASSRLEAG